ncbi:uncharacterized protein GGS25DRAFT_495582 [Hypoxylon fragiforme]|uniref:uncharacterized protein n=1 Tax=Hypoxylon fragiforme TaxID=63214 RepID=UPI0020C67B7E|nr:uncharacterized protein GGS25DRAFT_495582 [Hypoxylon fragiforme]KAI2607389.1 hypothetical protein GGS25DRAFT_495582 [Hypoxylon fragiforme]
MEKALKITPHYLRYLLIYTNQSIMLYYLYLTQRNIVELATFLRPTYIYIHIHTYALTFQVTSTASGLSTRAPLSYFAATQSRSGSWRLRWPQDSTDSKQTA